MFPAACFLFDCLGAFGVDWFIMFTFGFIVYCFSLLGCVLAVRLLLFSGFCVFCRVLEVVAGVLALLFCVCVLCLISCYFGCFNSVG